MTSLSKILSIYLLILPCAVFSAPLVSWESSESQKRFMNAQWKQDFFLLSNRFEPQTNKIFCGPTTAAIILNTLVLKEKRPYADARLSPEKTKFLPKDLEPYFYRYNQTNVFTPKAKSINRVLGKPNKEGKKDFGLQLRQFQALLEPHGVKANATVVSDKVKIDQVRQAIISGLKNPHTRVAVNYKRKALGQEGGGHISPLGAYDSKTDSVLIMDVNPEKYPWVWATIEDLYKSMKTHDTKENRGFVLVSMP